MDTGVQFYEEDPMEVPRPTAKKSKKTGSLTSMIISWGLAKDEHDAQYVMLAAAIALIIFAIGFYMIGNHKSPTVSEEQSAQDLNRIGP